MHQDLTEGETMKSIVHVSCPWANILLSPRSLPRLMPMVKRKNKTKAALNLICLEKLNKL